MRLFYTLHRGAVEARSHDGGRPTPTGNGRTIRAEEAPRFLCTRLGFGVHVASRRLRPETAIPNNRQGRPQIDRDRNEFERRTEKRETGPQFDKDDGHGCAETTTSAATAPDLFYRSWTFPRGAPTAGLHTDASRTVPFLDNGFSGREASMRTPLSRACTPPSFAAHAHATCRTARRAGQGCRPGSCFFRRDRFCELSQVCVNSDVPRSSLF